MADHHSLTSVSAAQGTRPRMIRWIGWGALWPAGLTLFLLAGFAVGSRMESPPRPLLDGAFEHRLAASRFIGLILAAMASAQAAVLAGLAWLTMVILRSTEPPQ